MVREAVEKICREFSGQCCIHKPVGPEAQVPEVTSSTLPGAPSSAPACSSCRGQTAGGGYQCRLDRFLWGGCLCNFFLWCISKGKHIYIIIVWEIWFTTGCLSVSCFPLYVSLCLVSFCTVCVPPALCVSLVASHMIQATTLWEPELPCLFLSTAPQHQTTAGGPLSSAVCDELLLKFRKLNIFCSLSEGSTEGVTGAFARPRSSVLKRRSASSRRRWRRSGSSWGWRGGGCSGALLEKGALHPSCCSHAPHRQTAQSKSLHPLEEKHIKGIVHKETLCCYLFCGTQSFLFFFLEKSFLPWSVVPNVRNDTTPY